MSLMSVEPPNTVSRFTDTTAKQLPLESAALSVDVAGGLARVRLLQRFKNAHAEPLSVTYKLPLPADASVGGFAFQIGDRRIVGHVDGRQEARETYERAVLQGHSAALLEQERSSLFTQEIGNIPPGATVEVEIDIDQPLLWLAEGSWEWRFPLSAAPRYLGAGPIEGKLEMEHSVGDIGARASLTMTIRDSIAEGRSPESPSHPLVTSRTVAGFQVELGSGNRMSLDRDVAVRWPAAGATASASIDVARPGVAALSGSAYGLLTIVPPAPDARALQVSRDLTLLIDTSGSMRGEPLTQAKRVACALVDSLGAGDQLEMIEFSNTSRSFERAPRAVDSGLKQRAIAWVGSLSASGGTEMLSGVKHAMRELRPGSQRQVILITDGLVGFEREIVTTLLAELPSSARLHALGVGSAVNRSLLAPIARAGRGIEAIIGLGEDAERAAQRILRRTVAPAVVDLVIEGSAVRRVSPSRLGDAFAGAPLRAAVELDPAGGEVVVRGRTADGAFVRTMRVAALEPGTGSEAIAKLYGRELCEDLEMRLSAGEPSNLIDSEIERTGKNFAIATRLTSWVAVTPEATVDPRSASRREVQPQALPYGMRAEPVARFYAPVGMAAPQPQSKVIEGGPERMRSLGMRAPAAMPGMAPPAMKSAPPAPAPSSRWEAAPEAKAKKDEAFSGRAREAVAVPPRAAGAAPPPPPPARSFYEEVGDRLKSALGIKKPLAGRIVLVAGDSATIELTVPVGGLELSYAGAEVKLTLVDGSEVAAEVVVERSTREGALAAGVIVRVVLSLPALLSKIAVVRVELQFAIVEARA